MKSPADDELVAVQGVRHHLQHRMNMFVYFNGLYNYIAMETMYIQSINVLQNLEIGNRKWGNKKCNFFFFFATIL